MRSPEKVAFFNAKNRCECKKASYYKDYGGRGIKFKFRSFEQWFEELGPRPSPSYSVHRIDNDGHYAPGNIRWATRKEQRENSRPVTDTSRMSAAAKARCTPEWRAAVSLRVKAQHAAGKFGSATVTPAGRARIRRKIRAQRTEISNKLRELWRGEFGERLRKIHNSPEVRERHRQGALRRYRGTNSN